MLIINVCILLITFFQLSDGYMFYNETEIQFNYSNDLQRILKNIDISDKCKVQFQQYGKSLISKEPEDFWAKQMFDAGVKIPSGLLKVPFAILGDFDECINIEAITKSYEIYGQYCLGRLPLTEMPLGQKEFILPDPEPRLVTPDGNSGMLLATCLPNECSAVDIQEIYSALGFGLLFYEEFCQTKASQPELDALSIAAISFLGIIFCIMLVSTIYDTTLYYSDKKAYHPMLIAFSILTNTKKILVTSTGSNQISCLHGIRVITTMWVIIGHKYSRMHALALLNYVDLLDWMDNVSSMFIMEATVAVDTFFLLAGMVIAYAYMGEMTKGTKFNIVLYYVHRYIRITPVLAVMVLFHVTLMRYFGTGPLWPNRIHLDFEANCETNWWKTLLHIQNYGDIAYCVPHAWYLSVDMQLFILSPIILIPLRKWPVYTLAATGFLTICSIVACFLTGWFFEFRGNQMAMMMQNVDGTMRMNYEQYYYAAIHTRAAPWLIGIILGYFVFNVKQNKNKMIINKIVLIFMWISSLAVLCACVFGGHNLLTDKYDRLANSFHLALLRPAWAVAVGFIIFACVAGCGGPVNWFLSLPTFQVLSKLTYTMYLTHIAVLYYTTTQMRDAIRFSNRERCYTFWGDFALIVFVSYILTLMFESPIIIIERYLLGGAKGKGKPAASSELQDKTTTVTGA